MPGKYSSVVERWTRALGFETDYEVSSLGRIRRIVRKKALVPTRIGYDGYPVVTLYYEHRAVFLTVHRMVLEAFVGRRPAGKECRHLDGDKTNCALSNLRWGTRKQNERDRRLHGKPKAAAKKFTDSEILEIRKAFDRGQTARVVAQRFGIDEKRAREIKNRRVRARA